MNKQNNTVNISSIKEQETKILKLNVKKEKKMVHFTEDTQDNEFKNMKTSKKCCIYHKKKEKIFPEDE